MAIAMSNCMVTGGPLLVTNWEGVLMGVVTPLGGMKILKSPLPPSTGEETLDSDLMTGELHWGWQMYDMEQSLEMNETPEAPEG